MIKSLFTPISPENLVRQQLQDARRMALEHMAAAEHHAALAKMYRDRILRLESVVGTAK